MPESQLVLSYLLGVGALLALGGLALYAVAHAKDRIIQEQQRTLDQEQRLRRAQEAFTDNAHHELRTPIQILAGHLQMLQDLAPTPDQAAILEEAHRTAQRMGRLVQGLLDLSSLHQGTLALHPALTDLNAHLGALAAHFHLRARAKGLTLRTELTPLPRPLVCDAARLSQALEALLDNALGFTSHGGVALRTSARADGRLWHLRFEVEDQGPGLSPDWERLMRPFEQEETSFRRRRGGLGLGLPLADGLVRLMGGSMGLRPLPSGVLAWVELALPEGGPTA